ncbi:MAG: polyphosphate kinase 2 family protein [Treponema sp.]|nr:polyphosphate kinase 2 family protein [Treponema sp.]
MSDILDEYRYDGSEKLNLKKVCHDSGGRKDQKAKLIKQTEKNLQEIADLQEKLYAESKESVLIVLQALDAAGKDSTIKHVLASVNPQGIIVHSFKGPNSTEESHDFLWRYHKRLPSRGIMCIFNRSYYEEVLVVNVHEFWKGYKMPKRTLTKDYIKNKYKDICSWENYLYGNGYRIVKFFLNLSKDEQKRRFLERIDRKEKNWKFSPNDIKERAYWDKYQEAFEDAINATSTKDCPWYVLPADQKWYTRYLVSEVLVQTLRDINPSFPKLPDDDKNRLADCKALLEAEGGTVPAKKEAKKEKAEKKAAAPKEQKPKKEKKDKKEKLTANAAIK